MIKVNFEIKVSPSNDIAYIDTMYKLFDDDIRASELENGISKFISDTIHDSDVSKMYVMNIVKL